MTLIQRSARDGNSLNRQQRLYFQELSNFFRSVADGLREGFIALLGVTAGTYKNISSVIFLTIFFSFVAIKITMISTTKTTTTTTIN